MWVPSHPAIPAREFVQEEFVVQARVANPAARFALQTCRYFRSYSWSRHALQTQQHISPYKRAGILEATRGPGMRCKPSSRFCPTHVQVFNRYSGSRHVLQTQQQVSPCTRAGPIFRSYSWSRHALLTQQHVSPYTHAVI